MSKSEKHTGPFNLYRRVADEPLWREAQIKADRNHDGILSDLITTAVQQYLWREQEADKKLGVRVGSWY